MFGGYSSPYGAIFDAEDQNGLRNITANSVSVQISDPQAWIEESAKLAKQ
jgi:hypothetical protein